ncbi:MAG: hypothetical protein ACLFSL_01580 [Candidatus Woesearchaeota archaeon]
MLNLSKTILFYKRKDVQEAIIEAAGNKEIAVKFGDMGFGKRPEILKFPGDVLEFAVRGATSFHSSEELWINPLQISTSLKQSELNEIRQGWDLVLDIDCPALDYSGLAAHLIVEALKYHGIKSISVKFSGNHGFHVAVPFESFPRVVGDEESRKMFPKMPKAIALYIKDMIADPLNKAIIDFEDGDISKVSDKTGKDKEVLLDNPEAENPDLNVESFLEIDTILISPRHLYRMPYSFNEKSGLVSVPVAPDKVKDFDIAAARPENVVVTGKFLDRTTAREDEARRLSVQALDYIGKSDIDKKINEDIQKSYKVVVNELRQYEEVTEKIPEELFPPCIHLMKAGMEDGKKRALFALVNFLTSVGWSYEDIEEWLDVWNKNNEEKGGEGLRDTIIKGQLRYHKAQKKKILPPNCDNANYYKSIGMSDKAVCQPDGFCKYIKNPVQYSTRKSYIAKQQEDGRKKRKSKSRKNTENLDAPQKDR